MLKKCFVFVMVLMLVPLMVACGEGRDGSARIDLESFEFPNPDLPAILIDIEGYGQIIAELYPEYAPITVHNFIELLEDGFYDGLTFHRIIDGFMMQGGCPYGTGFGGSGRNIVGEFASNEIENPLHHDRGVLSMARGGHDFNSASSQFFIMHANVRGLDRDYAAFGRVIYGIEVVDSVMESVTPLDHNGTIDSNEQPVIREIRLVNGSQIELD